MKKIFLFLFLAIFSVQISLADEGMWLFTMLNKNYEQMKQLGFKLTPEDIYSVNNACMKDAIVSFGGFCTGEIVSDKGLVLTNHHCGYGQIQAHSTVEHDYLTDGFWAASFQDELPNPGLFVRILVRMDDYSTEMLKGVKDNMTESERDEILKKNAEKLKKDAQKEFNEKDGYDVVIQSFFNNNQFFRIIYLKYEDVRLVGTPPSSIGKFGGDTDNWMWTRHTGDFSVFRIYSAPDGKPAKYSTNNVPFKPKYVIPVSISGIEEGDFSMILGFPGRTNRYSTTYGIEEVMNVTNVPRAKIRGIRQEVLMKDMRADQAVYIKYAAKYARSSNYWKYSIGQNQGLKRLKVLDKKQQLENQFAEWIKTNNKTEYFDVFAIQKEVYNSRHNFIYADTYLRECFTSGSEFVAFAYRSKKVVEMLKGHDNLELFNEEVLKLKKAGEDFFKNYNAETDKKSSKAMISLFVADVEKSFYPSFIESTDAIELDRIIENVFANSIFVDQAKFDKFIQMPTLSAVENDAALKIAMSVYSKIDEINTELAVGDEKLKRANRLWLKGLMEMQKDKLFYPDANSTIRMSYGTIGGYSPKDGINYKYYTTIEGIMEKDDINNPDFTVPSKLKKLYETKNYGRYADKNGKLPVCFLSNNDITGGNSGSPVLNGKGELIGIAFDGNWEAMSGDLAFEPDYQRTISVDIRYVLFIIEKYGEAKRLVDEMKIVK